MKPYMSTKLVNAEPAIRSNGVIFGENDLIPGVYPPIEHGYRLKYPDGYESFCPKEVFEKSYLPLSVNEDLKTSAPSISQQMVDDFIAETEVITMGDKTTVVRATLRNGFTIVEASSCVSPENYDEKMGAEICLGHIKDKVWMLLGFLLQTAVNGVEVHDESD